LTQERPMATISSAMIKLFAYTVLPVLLAFRPRPPGLADGSGLIELGEVGCGRWMTVLTESPNHKFFLQLLHDLKNRGQCAELGKMEMQSHLWRERFQKDRNGGPSRVRKMGCPSLVSFEQSISRMSKQTWELCGGVCFQVPNQYNYSGSTVDNYGRRDVSYDDELYPKGTFSTVKDLDYGYHAHYSAVRSTWQMYWIRKVLDRAPAVSSTRRPWIIFTSGAMGAGKGYVMKWMSDQGYFGLENVVHVDPDFFKSEMPEKEGYLREGSSAADAAAKSHRESAMMMEVAVRQAMAKRCNVWEDGSLQNADWYGQRFESIRNKVDDLSGYRIALVHIVPESKEQLLAQVEKRAKEEGRDVAEWRVMASWEASSKAVDLLKGQTDFFARVKNARGEEPQIIELSEEGPKQQGEDLWKIFSERLGGPALEKDLQQESEKKKQGQVVNPLRVSTKNVELLRSALPDGLPKTLEEFKALLAQTHSDLSGWDGSVSRLWNSLSNSKDQWQKCQLPWSSGLVKV